MAVQTQAPAAPSGTSLRAIARQLRRNLMATAGLLLLLSAILVAVLAPLLTPYSPGESPERITIDDIYGRPSAEHWLGTDDAGRDVWTNLIYGARVSLVVGFFASFISVAIGGTIGIVAGFFGGRVEASLMRLTDVVLVIPDLPLIIVLVGLTRPSLLNVILVIGVIGWTGTARLVRSQTLSVKQRKFVTRARALGAGNRHLIVRHIVPLVLPLLIANTVLVISLAILNESTLSFLGLADPTVISWGQMLNFAFTRGALTAGAWWALAPPGFGIVWIVVGCTLLGYGLEQILNPRVEGHHLSVGARMVARAAEPLSPASFLPPQPTRTAEPGPVVLEVRDLAIHYAAESGPPHRAVEGVSFSLREGELLGVVGESGCGKTTLMLSLLRLLPAAGRIVNGQVLFNQRDLLALSEPEMEDVRWRDIAIIFQGAMNALNPVRRVGGQVVEAILRHAPSGRALDRAAADRRAGELLELVGIPAWRRSQFPHQYSGGMRQRAMIAMALSCEPRVVIADEPTTALDVMIQAQILELLARLRKRLGLAVIFVTHDLGVVAEVCDRVLVMYGGVTAEYASVGTIFRDPRHPYTQELLKAFPDIARPGERLSSIPGSPPRLNALPAGCRFAPRCPHVFDRCQSEAPPLLQLGGEHLASCFRAAEANLVRRT